MSASKPSGQRTSLLLAYSYLILWITLSAAVILINKYVLSYSGFPYPISLTMVHMAFCSSLAAAVVKLGFSEVPSMPWEQYATTVLPIALLFAGTLWLGNAAYIYLSVAFIQMIKAMMPVTVFLVGVMMGTEAYSHSYALNMLVVAVGTGIASHGELNFSVLGVMYQGGSIITESFRLVLIQILLQSRGIKLNPVSTLYLIAPPCLLFLTIPFAFLEAPRMMNDPNIGFHPWLLLGSAAAAFALNMSVFLLIGKTSALTMNVGGVVKDWLLIALSVLLFTSPVTQLQLIGYGIAFLGVAWYNYTKLHASNQQAAAKAGVEAGTPRGTPRAVEAGALLADDAHKQHMNGETNGHSYDKEGAVNGYHKVNGSNGHASGYANGHANSYANGHANGYHQNGHVGNGLHQSGARTPTLSNGGARV